MFFHPARKMRRFTGGFLVSEIARNESASDGQPRVGCENQGGKVWLRRNQIDLAIQFRERGVQFFPLLLGEGRLRATGTAHPGIDLVFDSVIVRRTKQQLAHKIENLFADHCFLRSPGFASLSAIHSTSSRRNGSTSVTRPIDCKGWCSTARSTADGSISTQTVFTVGASILATASECWNAARSSTWVTSASFTRITF